MKKKKKREKVRIEFAPRWISRPRFDRVIDDEISVRSPQDRVSTTTRHFKEVSENLSRASDRFAEDDSVAGRIERIARITTYCIHEFWTAMACASSPRGPATHQGQSMQTTKRVRASRRAKQPALSLSSLANDASRSPDTCRLSLLRG